MVLSISAYNYRLSYNRAIHKDVPYDPYNHLWHSAKTWIHNLVEHDNRTNTDFIPHHVNDMGRINHFIIMSGTVITFEPFKRIAGHPKFPPAVDFEIESTGAIINIF